MKKLKKTSILIPDGMEGVYENVLNCLSQISNLNIHILSKKADRASRFSRYIKSFNNYPLDLSDEELIEYIKTFCKEKNINVLMPVHSHMIRFLSKYQKQFLPIVKIVPLPFEESLDIISNKIDFSKHLQNFKIPGPKFQVISNLKESNEMTISFPILIKPYEESKSGDGRGIVLIKNGNDFGSFLKEQTTDYPFFVQEYIEGFDVDCSVLCLNGEIIQHTIQQGILPGASQFSSHYGVRLIKDEHVFSVTKKLMKSLCWSGVAHVDLRYEKNLSSVKVIEVNGRFWSSIEASLLAGINFPKLILKLTLNGEIEKRSYTEIDFYNLRGLIKLIKTRPLFLINFNKLWNRTSIRFLVNDPLYWIIRRIKKLYFNISYLD